MINDTLRRYSCCDVHRRTVLSFMVLFMVDLGRVGVSRLAAQYSFFYNLSMRIVMVNFSPAKICW